MFDFFLIDQYIFIADEENFYNWYHRVVDDADADGHCRNTPFCDDPKKKKCLLDQGRIILGQGRLRS